MTNFALTAVHADGIETRFQSLAYIAAALLFILALAGLSKQVTAARGNKLGIIGMGLALVATVWVTQIGRAHV